jgi:hypothetical protein
VSGSASLGVEQAMLSHTLGIGPVAAVSRAYVALCLASLVPDERTVGREVSGNGYARMAASFQVLASPPNMAANTTTVAFPIASAPWGVLGYFELWDAPAGGNRLYWGALVDPADGTTPITLSVSAGDVLRFSAGALGVRIGPSGAGAAGGAFLPLVGGTLASPGNLTVGGWLTVTGAAATLGGPLSVTGPTALAGGATITGDSAMASGNFTLALDPTLPMHAATKQYIDGGGASGGGGPFLPTTGGSLNGPGNLVVGGTLGVTGASTLAYGSAAPLTFTSGSMAVAPGQNLILSLGGNGHTLALAGTGGSGNLFLATASSTQHTFDFSPNNTLVVSRYNRVQGPIVFSGAYSTSKSPLAMTFAASGSPTPSGGYFPYMQWATASDTVNVGAGGNCYMLDIQGNWGGAAMTGGRIILNIHSNQQAQTGNGTADKYYQAVNFAADASFNEGGTALTAAAARGHNFTGGGYARLHAGATNWYANVGFEMDIAAEAGSSMLRQMGLTIAHLTGHAVQGAMDDAALLFADQGNAAGWADLIKIGAGVASDPLDSVNGSIIHWVPSGNVATKPPAAKAGVDLRVGAISGDAWASTRHVLKGDGTAYHFNSRISQTATGVAIDVPLNVGSYVSVAGGGTGNTSGDLYIDNADVPGVWKATAVTGGVVTAAALAQGSQPYSATSPATLTLTNLNPVNGGAFTVNVAWAANTALSLQPSGGATQIGGNLQHVNPSNYTYNITSNNIASHTDPWMVSFIWVGNSGGAGTPLTGISAVNNYLINDIVSINGNVQGVSITHNIAPNGNAASGSRSAFTASLIQLGSSQGGTITGSGISSGAVINAWGRSNLGGISTLYTGALNGLNAVAKIQNGATYVLGSSGFEIDTSAETGSSYTAITQQLNVVLGTHQVRGYLNENMSQLIAAQAGAVADLMYGTRFIDQSAANPFDPKAKLTYVGRDNAAAVATVASNLDHGNTTVGAFHSRAPYSQTVPLQANGITGATRLTSDGAAASSFIYEAIKTGTGSGYTSNPTVTVTGGAGAVVNAIQGQGNVVAKVGVYNPGTGVPAEATASVSGAGTGATVALVMAGNTLNFGINSAIHCEARIVMRSTTGEAICWSCEFGARMGATASTTAIIGAPAWTQVWATAGAPAAIGISAPAADTTLGAINITVTPTSLTWSGGGQVRMTKSSRV